MLPPDVEARVAAIAADRLSGASELSLRALDAYAALPEGHHSSEVLRELAAKLEIAQPSMAVVRNVAHLCSQHLSEGGDPVAALRDLRREIMEAPVRISRQALKVFGGRVTLLTLSRSAAVVETCRLLASRNRLVAVYVLESRPLFEGRKTAEELAAEDIPTTLVADALGPSLVSRCDAVLAGADSVLRDGALVNKVGTYPLALAAKEAGKPFHGACEVLKIDAAHTAETFPGFSERPAEELEPPPKVSAVNVYFDLTPPRLVTSYVTDQGVYEPRRIAQLTML